MVLGKASDGRVEREFEALADMVIIFRVEIAAILFSLNSNARCVMLFQD